MGKYMILAHYSNLLTQKFALPSLISHAAQILESKTLNNNNGQAILSMYYLFQTVEFLHKVFKLEFLNINTITVEDLRNEIEVG